MANETTALLLPQDAKIQRDAEFAEQNVSMVQQIAQAQIQSAYIWAERHPRDWDVIEQQILKECRRPQFVAIDPDPKKYGSSNAMYGVPRGGEYQNGKWVPNIVTGLTIRFAEMALPFMKNIAVDLWPLGEDENQRIFRAVRIDYESNNLESEIIIVPKTVERRSTKEKDFVISSRTNSKGDPVYLIRATDDEIDTTKRALYSKAKRNLILSVLPGWLRKEAEAEIRQTQRQVDAQDPDAARKRLYTGFAKVGVTVEQLKEYIGHSNDLNPAEMEELRILYAGIAEGSTTWKEIVRAKEEASGDDKEELEAKIESLFAELEMPPAQIRKTKAGHIKDGPKKLIEYLEGLVAKKRNDGSRPKTEEKKPDHPSPAAGAENSTREAQKTAAPEIVAENLDAEPSGELFEKQPSPAQDAKSHSKPDPPSIDIENW